ncbi:hypothetical protein [Undibacterium hunanense]|nr:hypothetical protein [Undibacterium hunanense]
MSHAVMNHVIGRAVALRCPSHAGRLALAAVLWKTPFLSYLPF